jgi:hypothetical protein
MTGPRLLVGAFRLLREARKIYLIDVVGCAKFIDFLLQHNRLMPYEEFRGAGWEPWLPQLRRIEALRFLKNGVTLAEDWRMELLGTDAWRTTR